MQDTWVIEYRKRRNREAEAAEPDLRTDEDKRLERDANKRKRAEYLERLARQRERQGGRWETFAGIVPGTVPAVVVGPDRVGPSARGQLSGGRPQGRKTTPKASSASRGKSRRSDDDPPGELTRRSPDDDVAPDSQAPQVARVDIGALRRIRAALPADEAELLADLDYLIEQVEQRGWPL
jgi:hypothetical protein